jgi:hypothetical protein
MLRKRLWTHQKGRNGIKDLGSRWLLYLRKKRTTMDSIGGWSSGLLESGGTLKKTLHVIVSMKVTKQEAQYYVAS